MRMMLLAFLVALPAARPAEAGSAARPRLAVVAVVDQMRADYLERDPAFSGGFKRLAGEGLVFTQARHLHLPTETGPGHAAISTGRAPATHGIVSNDWFDRAAGADTYCVADSPYGIGPGHLEGPTLADALKAADPRARVFSVAGKDRAAVLLGGRRPDLALWLDRSRGIFTTSSYYRRPDWLDGFNAGLRASGLLPLKDGKVPAEVLASSAFDEATARLVSELSRRERVGRGPSTDLLMVSLSATDIVGHRYGVEAPEMSAQLRAVDGILGRLMSEWEDLSGGSVLLAFTGDHGAIPAPEDPSGRARGVRRRDWDAFGSEMEKALQARRPAPGKAWIVSNLTPHVYLNRALAAERGLDWAAFRREAAEALSTVDGVARALSADDAALPPASDPLSAVLRRSLRADRTGDVVVVLAEDLLLHDQPTGTNHGTPWDYDARVPLVFWGRGARAARSDEPASPMDIAPTLGAVLGLRYPPADGGRLRAELASEAR